MNSRNGGIKHEANVNLLSSINVLLRDTGCPKDSSEENHKDKKLYQSPVPVG